MIVIAIVPCPCACYTVRNAVYRAASGRYLLPAERSTRKRKLMFMGKRSNKSVGSIRLRLSVAEILYNACIASDGYRTVFLQSLGVSVGRIGIISSLSTIANIVAPPVWGVISDRIRSPRLCFALCLGLSALLLAAVPFASQIGAPLYILMITCLAMASLFTGPANNMIEQWLVRIDNSGIGISYGSVRLWASLGYAVMGIAYTRILEKLPVSSVYFFYLVFAIPAILLALSLPDPGAAAERKAPRLRLREMPFRRICHYWIAVYLIYTLLNTVPHNWKITYFVYLLNDYGYSSISFGIFMFLSALCEVPALIISKRVIARFGLMRTLFFCIAASVAETLCYALGTSIVYVYIGQIIKGFSLGMSMACSIQLVYRLAHKGLETTTQALIGSVSSIVTIVVAAFGGFALEAMGLRPFFGLISVLEGFAGLVLLAGLAVGTLCLKKPLPEGV